VKIGDWIGPAQRGHYAKCIHNGYAYVSGGNSLDDSQTFNDMWRSSNLVHWEKTCDLPLEMRDWKSAILISFKGLLYFFGGGKYTVSGGTIVPPISTNTKIFQSKDDGKTWTIIGQNDLFNSFWWGDAVATEQFIVAISGSDYNNSMTNNNRIIYFDESLKVKLISKTIPGRHATGVAVDDKGNIGLCLGFRQNDFHILKNIV